MSGKTPQVGIKEKLYDFIREYGQAFDITLVIHLIIYLITLFFFPAKEIFINMLAIDSTITALRFIKTIYENKDDIINRFNMNKLYETDLLMRTSKEYINTKYPEYAQHFDFNNEGHVNLIKKYFFYTISQILSWIFGMIFWGYGLWIFNAILLLFAIPICYITIISSIGFMKLFTIVITRFKSVGTFILSKLTAKIINNLTETCLGTSPKIDHNEMIEFYEDFSTSVDATFIFLKAVILQTLIYYVKKTDNIFYYSLVEIFHRYQIESLMYQSSGETGENKLKLLYEIVRGRKWKEFLKPKTVNMIFELYETKNNDMYARRMGVFFRNIHINLIRLMTMWSLAMISPLLAVCVDAYFTFIETRFSMSQNYLTYAIGAIILCSNNYLAGSILVISSEIITKPLIDYIEEKELLSKYVIRSKDQVALLILIPIIWKLNYFSIILPPVIQYVNNQSIHNAMIQVVTILALLSTNNLWHITFMFTICLIANNMLSNESSPPQKININMIDDYVIGPTIRKEIAGNNMEIARRYEANIIPIYKINEPTPLTRTNVCKYLSTWKWTNN